MLYIFQLLTPFSSYPRQANEDQLRYSACSKAKQRQSNRQVRSSASVKLKSNWLKDSPPELSQPRLTGALSTGWEGGQA